jgi:uncharacterized OsmC-like protein
MMSKLQSFFERKSQALAARQDDFSKDPTKAIVQVKASSWVGGVTGTRPTRMGEYIVISDSAPGLGGNSLGPTSPEMLLGALASCLVHTYLIQATLMQIPLDHLEIAVQGELDMQAVVGLPTTQAPQLAKITYQPTVTSSASPEEIAQMHKAVEASCPVLNTIRMPTAVTRLL